jgi:hypothetical protein
MIEIGISEKRFYKNGKEKKFKFSIQLGSELMLV